MIKFVVRFSNKRKNPQIYQAQMDKITDPSEPAGYYYQLNSYHQSYKNRKTNFPFAFFQHHVYRTFNDTNCFDTREEAMLAMQKLFVESVRNDIDNELKIISAAEDRIHNLKQLKLNKVKFAKL